MLRSAASKVMWVGRATVFLVGLAVMVGLVFGAASVALGANGKPLLLGKKNVASAISTLVKKGTGPALKLQVGAGQPPLAVSSSTRVANLNADQLDGKDSTEYLGKSEKAADAAHADSADQLDGLDSTAFLHATHSATATYNNPNQTISANSCNQSNVLPSNGGTIQPGEVSLAFPHSNFPSGLSVEGMVEDQESTYIAFRICNLTGQALSANGGTVTVYSFRP